MSYYTRLELSWDDADYVHGSVTSEDLVVAAKSFVTMHNWSENVLDDLRRSCESSDFGPPAFKGAYAHGTIQLVQHLSRQFPDVVFFAKGAGEEFHDIWIRQFRNGVATVERGPFDEIAPPLPSELLAAAKQAATAAREKSKLKDLPWWKRLLK